jgi:hypothetical protein
MGGHSNRGCRYRLTSPEIYSARFLIFRERALPARLRVKPRPMMSVVPSAFHDGNRQGIDDGNCPLRLRSVRDHFSGALSGLFLARLFPEHYRHDATRRFVQTSMAMVSLLSALVLGLLVATAKKQIRHEQSKS